MNIIDAVEPAQVDSPPPAAPLLRIACLEPSATAICLELGLGENIVGVTHECEAILAHFDLHNNCLDSAEGQATEPSTATPKTPKKHRPLVLTRSGLTVNSQADIHLAVQKTAAAAAQVAASITTASSDADVTNCPIRNRNGQSDEFLSSERLSGECLSAVSDIPSTYPLIEERMKSAQPTVIFTQDLCDVCAPTVADVRRCLWNNNNKAGGDIGGSSILSVVSLQPTNLHEVADTFVTIADACGVRERGQRMKDEFLKNLKTLQRTVQENRQNESDGDANTIPTMLILEWLDPVFDSGHWTYQMMEYACVRSARPKKQTHKALVIEWEDVHSADPDVVVVGCCGFDLERNVQDTLTKREQLRSLRAGRNNRIYASNGDWYIAQPAPFLLQGVVLLAQCAYQNEPRVLEAIARLGYKTIGWQAVDVMKARIDQTEQAKVEKRNVKNCGIGDMEDMIVPDEDNPGFAKLHNVACERGEATYTDPETGYAVFTRIAHEKRGKCCGSGCRHCPYSHNNVKNKAAKIQQPSVLHEQRGERDSNDGSRASNIFSTKHEEVKVLFFSGGKDSFLAIRALVESYYENGPFGLILMTTFDASTRIIAHQEVGVDQVIRQASHLDITLVGIPLRRASGETYVERIQCGLNVIRSFIPSESRVSSLVFGDLHLSHIREWRDKILTQLECKLEYPLWRRSYSELLEDLESSKVPCQVSSSAREEVVPLGVAFDRKLYERLIDTDVDGFGELGEFHSLAMVWEVPRSIGLGLRSK